MTRTIATGSDAAFVKSWDGWDEMDTMSVVLYAVELNREFYTAEQLAKLDQYAVIDVCIMHDKSILEFYGFTEKQLADHAANPTEPMDGSTFVIPFKIAQA